MSAKKTTVDIDGTRVDIRGLEPYKNYKITPSNGISFVINIDELGNILRLERSNTDNNNGSQSVRGISGKKVVVKQSGAGPQSIQNVVSDGPLHLSQNM